MTNKLITSVVAGAVLAISVAVGASAAASSEAGRRRIDWYSHKTTVAVHPTQLG